VQLWGGVIGAVIVLVYITQVGDFVGEETLVALEFVSCIHRALDSDDECE